VFISIKMIFPDFLVFVDKLEVLLLRVVDEIQLFVFIFGFIKV